MSLPDGSVMSGESTTTEDISLSVQATNALREKLGLKPLRDGPSAQEQQIVEQRKVKEADEKQAEREVDVELRLEKMRNKRLLAKEMEGPSASERLRKKGEVAATSDFSSWVQHSRKLSKEEALAKKREEELNAQDEAAAEYSSKDLDGLTVTHNAADIAAGETVIMTLKDSTVLSERDGDVEMNEEEDAMENVTMAENDRTKKRLELKKGKAYARYKEALADAESGAMDGAGGVLSHYDDIDPVTGEPRKAGAADGREVTDTFQLGEAGAAADAKAQKLAAIKAKLAQGSIGAARTTAGSGTAVSVAGTMDRTVAEDYYTRQEMTAFAKPKAKKRRKVRKKKRSIADELQPLEDAGADDRGSRKDAAKARRERQEDGARDDKRQRGYDAAMDKAMASSRFSSEMDGLSWDPEEREAEAQSLARARQLTSKAESGLAMGLDAVKEQVERAKTAQAAAAEVAGGDDDEAGGGVGADVLSFSVTGEFCKAVTTDHLKQKAAAAKARAAAAEQVLEGSEDEDETEQSSSGWLAAGGEAIGDIKPTKKAAPLPVLPVAAQKAMTVEPMASSGVVAALELARSKGMLRDVEREEKAFGRTNDMKWQRTQEADEEKVEVARRAEELKKRGGGGKGRPGDKRPYVPAPAWSGPRPRQGNLDDIQRIEEMMKAKASTRRIDYNDENGRQLTTKEAFRRLAHQFHGITPGKKKLEKMMRLEAEEKKMHEMSVIDTPLQSTAALAAEAERQGKAFINLDAKKVSEKELKRLKKRAKKAKLNNK